MEKTTIRRWGRSLGVVIPREEVVRKGLKSGQRVQIAVEPLPGPDDFADLCGTVQWRKSGQGYKEQLRLEWGE